MHVHRLAWALGAVLVCGLPRDAAIADSPQVAVDDVVDAVGAYVDGYAREFAYLLADETYVQEVIPDGRAAPRLRRMIRGELFLTFLESERRWMAVHDVVSVDGDPVADRDDLRTLLQSESPASVGARLAERNARFNVGRVARNFNEPTLALQVFDTVRLERFRFSSQGATVEDGQTLLTLGFEEASSPTLIRSSRSGPVYATGEVVVEAGSGRVRRTIIRIDDGAVHAELETRYRFDPALDLWVPSAFFERYRLDDGDGSQTIVCEARYENYRRFGTTGRLLIPGAD